MIGCLTETTTCVVAKPLVLSNWIELEILFFFYSNSSVSCQFLIFKIPLYQVIFMKNHLEIVFFGTLCYKNEAFVLFPKHKFLIFLGCLMAEIYQIMYFLHQCFWSLPL